MGLADAVEGRPSYPNRCRWVEFVDSLPQEPVADDEYSEAEAAVRLMEGWEHPEYGTQEPWPVAPLLRTLRAEGYSLAPEAAYVHRRGECACRLSAL